MTPTETAEHEERLRQIKEHELKVKITSVASRELIEEDFIEMPVTKENLKSILTSGIRKKKRRISNGI